MTTPRMLAVSISCVSVIILSLSLYLCEFASGRLRVVQCCLCERCQGGSERELAVIDEISPWCPHFSSLAKKKRQRQPKEKKKEKKARQR